MLLKSMGAAIDRFSFPFTLSNLRKTMLSRKLIMSIVVLVVLFLGGRAVFAQNSAIFAVTAATPESAQAGKQIAFEVMITNTGTETWVSEEYSVLVKIYDANDNYLTEIDKVGQFEDIDPGEVLTTGVPFDIPADYSGTYYYSINVEFEDASFLSSSYFSLRIIPIEEAKVFTGTFKISYTNNSRSSPSTNVDLSLLSQSTPKQSLDLRVSARDSSG